MAYAVAGATRARWVKRTGPRRADGILSSLSNLWNAFAEPVGFAYSTTGLVVAVAALGVYAVARRSLEAALLIVTPIAANSAQRCSVCTRSSGVLSSFVPAVMLLVGAGLWALVDLGAGRGRLFAVVAIALVLAYPAVTALRNLISPPGHEEVKTVIRHVESNWRPGDALYVGFQSQFPFRYYAECDDCDVLGPKGRPQSSGLQIRVICPITTDRDAWPEFAVEAGRATLEVRRDLKRLRGKPRVWLV